MISSHPLLQEDLQFIYTQTVHELTFLNQKTLLITGGTGFFGKGFLEFLIFAMTHHHLKLKVIVLSRNPSRFQKNFPHLCEHIHFIQGDILDFDVDEKIDFILHAATDADAHLINSQPLLMLESICKGAQNIARIAKKCGATRFLHTSSGAVYGSFPPGLTKVGEDFTGAPDLTLPGSSYGEGKRWAELYLNLFGQKNQIAMIHARCFAFLGPYLPLRAHYAIGNFIGDGLEKKDIQIKGDGTPLRSYLYWGDLVIWLLKLLVHGKEFTSYNVGSDQSVSIAQLARMVAQFFPGQKIFIQNPNPTAKIQAYVPDISKAQQLGLKVHVSLEESLRRTIQVLSTNRPPSLSSHDGN